MFKYNPDKTYIGFIFVSGHGMVKNGTTQLLLNQRNNNTGYYTLASVEAHITQLTNYNKSAYIVGIFATERITFDKDHHSGMFC